MRYILSISEFDIDAINVHDETALDIAKKRRFYHGVDIFQKHIASIKNPLAIEGEKKDEKPPSSKKLKKKFNK